MAELRKMLKDRIGDGSVDDFLFEVNMTVQPDVNDRVTMSTMYAYVSGQRDIAGKGARLLAKYFYAKEDMQMVDAISKVTLGIPYPLSEMGSGRS